MSQVSEELELELSGSVYWYTGTSRKSCNTDPMARGFAGTRRGDLTELKFGLVQKNQNDCRRVLIS